MRQFSVRYTLCITVLNLIAYCTTATQVFMIIYRDYRRIIDATFFIYVYSFLMKMKLILLRLFIALEYVFCASDRSHVSFRFCDFSDITRFQLI